MVGMLLKQQVQQVELIYPNAIQHNMQSIYQIIGVNTTGTKTTNYKRENHVNIQL